MSQEAKNYLRRMKKDAEAEARETTKRIAAKKQEQRKKLAAEARTRQRQKAELCQREDWQTTDLMVSLAEAQQKARQLHNMYLAKLKAELAKDGYDVTILDKMDELPKSNIDALTIA
jgi:tRNA 2-selenouridine synthase SelU